MARPLRIEYPFALYHVIARGNGYQNIYHDDDDRLKFLDWIGDAVKMHNIICHAYCLMDNHYHLLLETPDANLSKSMRDINGNYTQWFNAKHKTVGHLFQGRYKSFVIEKETYLLEVARYISLNPVRANLVNHPGHWKWSGFQSSVKDIESPKWLYSDSILGCFADKKGDAQKMYEQFVIDGINSRDPHKDVKNGFLLGSPQFIDWIRENQTRGSGQIKDCPREQRIVGRPSLEELFDSISTKEERNKMIQFARIRCGYPATEIAKYVKLDPSVIGRISRGKYNKKVVNKT